MLFFDANNKEVKVGIVNVHTGFIQYPLFECQRRFGSFFIRILLQICWIESLILCWIRMKTNLKQIKRNLWINTVQWTNYFFLKQYWDDLLYYVFSKLGNFDFFKILLLILLRAHGKFSFTTNSTFVNFNGNWNVIFIHYWLWSVILLPMLKHWEWQKLNKLDIANKFHILPLQIHPSIQEFLIIVNMYLN